MALVVASRRHGRLCDLCASCFDSRNTKNYRYQGDHHNNLVDLERAADDDCYICVRLYADYQKAAETQSRRLAMINSHYRILPTHDLREWTLNFELSTRRRTIESQFVVLEHRQYPGRQLNDNFAPDMRDPRCIERARAWLHDCRKNHNCQAEHRTGRLEMHPTRLLHIRPSGNGLINVRLHYPRNKTRHVDYLTLSHMWGDQKFVTLTQENHNSFLQCIPMESLSRTFKDAIRVTLALGFKYLWIDSLCILQDDDQDWKNESESMAHIYKNAVCNLCASGSTSRSTGLLKKNRATNPLPPVIHFEGRGPHQTKVISESAPWQSLRDAPLYRRAWVLQEQILAARALHFSDDQIHWECAEVYANEVWPLGWPVYVGGPHAPAGSPFQRRFSQAQTDEVAWHITIDRHDTSLSTAAGRDRVWTGIIQDYSSRQLTYSQDRLPALAGLIAEFRRLEVAGRCVAGIWDAHAHNQLLWIQSTPTHPSTSVTTPQPSERSSLPSWSWASTGTTVWWNVYQVANFDKDDRLCKIKLKQRSSEPYPYFYIDGLLLKLRLEECGPRIEPDATAYNCQRIHKSIKLYLHRFRLSCTYYVDSWFLSEVSDSNPGANLISLDSLVYKTVALPVQWYRRQYQGIFCLLLWRDSRFGPGVYRRVGIVKMVERDLFYLHKSSPRKDVIEELQFYARRVQKNDFLQRNDDGTYRIELI